MIELVPAALTHVGPIANRMREWDRIECRAHGSSPKQALRLGLAGSLDTFTALLDGRPEAMMGLTPTNSLSGTGGPWFLGTDEVYRHPRAMLAFAPHVLGKWRAELPHLSNIVASGNTKAITMLKRWGFTVEVGHLEFGGVPFRRFFL